MQESLGKRCVCRNIHVVIVALLFAVCAPDIHAEIIITLRQDFIEQYKDRATMEVCFEVKHAKNRPNSARQDGDLHVAGCADAAGLPAVAEIMNAKDVLEVVAAVNDAEGQTCIPMSGAWRIWCEHGGDSIQQQGGNCDVTNTNPDHVFEIHPLSHVGDSDIRATWHPIPGYETKDAERAFNNYEGKSCSISHDPEAGTTTITTVGAGYNYPEFIMEVRKPPSTIEDGVTIMADVRDLEGELLVRNRRMVFAKGTAPELIARHLEVGDRLHVLGIPRISLKLVDWRVDNAERERSENDRDVLSWNLPYEIIVVAAYLDD